MALANGGPTLQPVSGEAITQSGIPGTSWTTPGLTPGVYTVTVDGYAADGTTALAQGIASADTSGNGSVAVTLGYITTGSGTGSLDLTWDLSAVGGTLVVQLTDPSGTKTTPSLTTTGTLYHYANSSAAVGTYQIVSAVVQGTQVALETDTAVVAAGSTTVSRRTVATDELSAITFALDKGTVYGLLSGGHDTLTPLTNLGPADHSCTWTSSDPAVATVTTSGEVDFHKAGTTTIAAKQR